MTTYNAAQIAASKLNMRMTFSTRKTVCVVFNPLFELKALKIRFWYLSFVAANEHSR